MFLYGGGWTSGERGTYAFVGAALAQRGFTTVVPDYRLYPSVQFPDFVEDAAAAYRYAVERLAGGCGARRPVVVAGHSAGAHLAALVALDRARAAGEKGHVGPPAALIGLAGPYAFDPTTWPSTRDIFRPALGKADEARPIAHVRRGAPPALLLHGRDDETVKRYNSADMLAALRAHGNVAVLTEYDEIGHVGLVTAIARPLRWRAPVLADIVRFIERHVPGAEDAPACVGDRTPGRG